MKLYLLRIATVTLLVLLCNYTILFTVHAPLPAEYWVREFIIVKLYLAGQMPGPKIIIVGGSSTLFGIDAAEIQKRLGRSAINLGLHASFPLDRHLELARQVARPGDCVVLALEPAYYYFYSTTWNTWVLRNMLAWDRHDFDRRPALKRLERFLLSSDPSITFDLAQAAIDQRFFPSTVARRLEALEPDAKVIARYQALRGTARGFDFTLANLDTNGDLLNTQSHEVFRGDVWPTTMPSGISSFARDLLLPFLQEMAGRHVRVVFDYTPYCYHTAPDDGWRIPDASFRAALTQLGGTLIENRDALFFPDTAFFNSNLHLNDEGRREHTQRLIAALAAQLGSPGL